jgi:hypothetical protein
VALPVVLRDRTSPAFLPLLVTRPSPARIEDDRTADVDETPTPIRVPAWRTASQHSGEYAALAEFLSRRLQTLSHATADKLSKELVALAEAFRGWRAEPPTDDLRLEMLRRLSQYHEMASDLLSGSR